MKKPSLSKTLLTTSLAAALLVGGGAALLHGTAYADTSAAASGAATSDTQSAPGKDVKHHKFAGARMEGGFVFKEAATLLGTDAKTLGTELHGGKTLVQIAQEKQGWNEDTLVQKLVDAINAKLDDQVKNGKMTQAQADKAKTSLSDRVKKAVEGQMRFGERGHGDKGGFGGPAATKDMATFLKLSETDLKAKLQAGQSLAAIADAQGVKEDQLIAHIKDGMTDKIKGFVEKVHKAKQQPADQAQTPAAPAPAAAAQQ